MKQVSFQSSHPKFPKKKNWSTSIDPHFGTQATLSSAKLKLRMQLFCILSCYLLNDDCYYFHICDSQTQRTPRLSCLVSFPFFPLNLLLPSSFQTPYFFWNHVEAVVSHSLFACLYSSEEFLIIVLLHRFPFFWGRSPSNRYIYLPMCHR